MAVTIKIFSSYSGSGTKKAVRELQSLQKEAQASGRGISANLYGAAARMRTVGDRMQSVGTTLTKKVTLPIVGLGVAAIKSAESVQKGLNRVRSGTGATGKQLEGLEASFRTVANSSGRSFDEIGAAIADVNTRLGLTGKPLENVTGKFLTLSRVTGQETAPLLAEVSKAANDAGVKAAEMGGFLDKLLVTSQKTGISVTDLAGSMYRFGSPLRQVGFSLDQTMATLGAFEKSGVNTKLVMGSLRIALGKMAKAGEKDLPAALAKGIASIKSAGSSGDAARKAIELFGARAGPDMAAAIREGRFEIGDLQKALEGSDGALQRTGDATKTFSGSIMVLKNQAALAFEPFGKMIIPYLQKLVAVGARVVKWMQNLSPGWRDFIIKALAVAAALGPILGIVGKLISALSVVTKVVAGLNFVLAANPIGLVVLAIAGLVAGLVIAYKKSETFRKVVDAVASVLAKVFKKALEVVGKVIGWVLKHWRGLLQAFLIASGPIGWITLYVIKNFTKIKTELGKAFVWIKGKWDWMWGVFKKTPAYAIFKVMADAMKKVAGLIVKHWDGIKSTIAKAINAIGGFINKAFGWAGVKVPLVTWGQKTGSGSKVTTTATKAGKSGVLLAHGGLITRPTAAIVGEDGPELVLPLSKPRRMQELLAKSGIMDELSPRGALDRIKGAAKSLWGGVGKVWYGLKGMAGKLQLPKLPSFLANLFPTILSRVWEKIKNVTNKGGKIIEIAKRYLGVPYVWGGSTPRGFDCSGFAQYVYKQAGINIQRVATAQAWGSGGKWTTKPRPGDLAFYHASSDPAKFMHHVGIFAGGGKMIHAPHTGDVVRYGPLNADLFGFKTWMGKGGSFTARRPTIVGVGERGAEHVQVTPLGKERPSVYIASGAVVVNVNGTGAGAGELRLAVRTAVEPALRRLAREVLANGGRR